MLIIFVFVSSFFGIPPKTAAKNRAKMTKRERIHIVIYQSNLVITGYRIRLIVIPLPLKLNS